MEQPQQHLPHSPVESRKEVKQFLLCVNLHDMIGAFESTKFDGPVKSPFCPGFVIPVKAGIQAFQAVLDSGFRRSDGFFDFLRDHQI